MAMEKPSSELPADAISQVKWEEVSMPQRAESDEVGQPDIYAAISRESPELELLTP